MRTPFTVYPTSDDFAQKLRVAAAIAGKSRSAYICERLQEAVQRDLEQVSKIQEDFVPVKAGQR